MRHFACAFRLLGSFLGFARGEMPLVTWGGDLRLPRGGPLNSFAVQKGLIENLWRDFFSDPSQWWDHRLAKVDASYPDFKHKKTKKGLWLDGKLNPPWVESELASLAPGTLQIGIFSWNKGLERHIKAAKYRKALSIFEQMQKEGMKPDQYTFVQVLSACGSLGALEEGKHIHTQIVQSGFELDMYVSSSLVDMYAKCGSIQDARRVFNKMSSRNVVSWNIMILGHVKCGQGQKALELYNWMQKEKVEPNAITFVGLLNACASVAALEEGRHVHEQMIQSKFKLDIFVYNSLMDMYAKCGSIEDAWRVFENMSSRDVVSWNTMLRGYSMHGHTKEPLALFERMRQEGVEMNSVTFISLLSACSHAGFVDEALYYFDWMSSVHSILPTVEHYACLVHLHGRAGRLHEAEDIFRTMSCEPNIVVWRSLLSACRIQGNMDMGERIGKRVLELYPDNTAGYVLLANIYAAAGKWKSKAKIQHQRTERCPKKHPGRTWIEVNKNVHSFTVDDQEHPQIDEIHAELMKLSRQMNEAGYVPDVTSVLHDVEEDEKVSRLALHSEKLAIAFGLISTPPTFPIRIFKNLRVCDDCHASIKVISKLVQRTIIVRDVNRFHHIEDGICSCGEYW